jgi:adenine deaminase
MTPIATAAAVLRRLTCGVTIMAAVSSQVPATIAVGPPSGDGGLVALVNVNVAPVTMDRVLRRQTVIVRGDRIVEMGPASQIQLPAGASIIDGQDQYLLPRLTDTHSYLASLHFGQASPQLTEPFFVLYLLRGVTTIRGMATRLGHGTRGSSPEDCAPFRQW